MPVYDDDDDDDEEEEEEEEKSSQVAFNKNKWQSHEFYKQVKWK